MRSDARFLATPEFEVPPGSGERAIADVMFQGLKARRFQVSEPNDIEFAHEIRCRSGDLEYELMIGFNHEDDKSWQVSCPPVLGFWSRLLGRSEVSEHERLIRAIHDILQTEPRFNDVRWQKDFGNTKGESDTPW